MVVVCSPTATFSIALCLTLLLSKPTLRLAAFSQGVTDVTKDVGLDNTDGIIAAFGDFDSDRDTDVFVIVEQDLNLYHYIATTTYQYPFVVNGAVIRAIFQPFSEEPSPSSVKTTCTKVEVYLWQGSQLKFSKAAAYVKVGAEKLITNVSPADFDGDGCMDLLIVTRDRSGSGPFKVTIYWSDDKKLGKGYETDIEDEPLVLDINGDLLPDFFGTDSSGSRKYWISQTSPKRQFVAKDQSNHTTTTIRVPNSNAFVDLTGDFHADLLVVAEDPRTHSPIFEVWESDAGTLEFDRGLTTTLPIEAKGVTVSNIGQASLGDFDADGRMDVLIPVCLTSDCRQSSFYLYSDKKWNVMLTNEQSWWKFPRPSTSVTESSLSQVVARIGDISMDGYPDAVCILENLKGGKSVVILENIPCSSSYGNCQGSRTFRVRKDIPILKKIKNPAVVTLFDLYENGALDFFIVEEKSSKFSIKAVKNDFSSDTSFLKTAVLSGRCYKDCACRSSHTPYGANQPGAMVRYRTTTPDGKRLIGVGTQLCQSAYLSLQLPYIVFGLGRTPNFVDEIEVGVPQGSSPVNRVHQWQSLIPNSQVIILPYPPDKPSEWQTKLLVTPSKLLLQIGGVLLGICLLVAGLILILHIKEKREDEREKRQEAHKFHFDAL